MVVGHVFVFFFFLPFQRRFPCRIRFRFTCGVFFRESLLSRFFFGDQAFRFFSGGLVDRGLFCGLFGRDLRAVFDQPGRKGSGGVSPLKSNVFTGSPEV
jgi:hypothetical protein